MEDMSVDKVDEEGFGGRDDGVNAARINMACQLPQQCQFSNVVARYEGYTR
jgi:hypothetical protein